MIARNAMRVISSRNVNELATALRSGKVIAMPTDTVYGLIGLAAPSVKRRIYRIKRRPRGKPLPLLVSNIAMARRIAKTDPRILQFLRNAWPGPITVALRNKKTLSGFKKQRLIAVRMPADRVIRKLLKRVNRHLIGTSANISGDEPLTRAEDVVRIFEGERFQPDLIVRTTVPVRKQVVASTVVDLSSGEPMLLRKGPVPFSKIKELWGEAA